MKFEIKNPILMVLSAIFLSASAQAQLTGVDVTPGSTAAGAASIHSAAFTTTAVIPGDGRIVLSYPVGFDVSGALLVSSADLDGTLSVSTSGQDVVIDRSGGTDAPAGAITLQVGNVTNHTTSGTGYTVVITTQTLNGAADIDTGADTNYVVNAAGLDHFAVTGQGASEVAGSNIALTVTALDPYDNTVVAFTNTADLSDLTGTLSPAQTGSFTAGQWTGAVTVQKTHLSNTVTATDNGKSGSTAAFEVTPAALAGFEFATISSPQTAGSWIAVALTAVDGFGNIKSDFTGTADLSEATGTLSVQSTGTQTTDAFAAGGWSGAVQITAAAQDIQITASGSGQTGTSGFFNVVAGSVDHFIVSAVGDQNAGAPFLVTVTAQDANSNTASSFTGTVTLSDLTGSLSPVTSGSFTGGVWTGNLTVTQTRTGNTLSVNDGAGHTGASNAFNVVTSTVDYFDISSIGANQAAGVGFPVTIRAMDANANVVTTENSTVNLSDESGSISPSQITFTAGTWTGTVTVETSGTGNVLTVNGLGESSASNSFNVSHAGLDHFEIASVASPQTAGTGFNIDLLALDAYGNTVESFNSRVPISISAGGISPTTSGFFVQGALTQPVTINQANKDLAIAVDDGSGHSGSSNLFNVEPGSLNRFVLASVADQATGAPFAVTITAEDANGNTVTDFTGGGNTVDLSHSGAGAMTPLQSGDFIQGVWTGNVTISQTQTNDRILVQNSNGSEVGQSGLFNVTAITIDHFNISPLSVDQQAGSAFPVTLTAQDADNNTVIGFNGTAILLDETGTNSQQSVVFTSGTWTGNVMITKAMTGNSLTVTAQGKSGASNEFTVAPGSVSRFEYALVGSPQTAGQGFNVTLTALDAWENTATGFTGNVTFTEGTGTVSPSSSGSFTAGTRIETLQISMAQSNLRLQADDGSGHSGQSNYFNVQAAGVDHYALAITGNQIAGDPFTLSITAQDANNNTASSFTGTVNLSDLTGTLQPSVSGNFVGGQWTGNVTVFQATTGNRITATRSGGSESGQSVAFDLADPPGIRVVDTQVSQSTVTAGQSQNWTLKMAVSNLSSYAATLQSVTLRFDLAGQAQNDYTVIAPSAFLLSGNATLAGGATDTVVVTIDQTGAGRGDVYIGGVVSCQDSNTGRTIPAQGSTGVVVQQAAQLDIFDLQASQSSVTLGQDSLWTVNLIVQNTGEAALQIDSAAVDNALSFSIGNNWQVLRPDSLNGGGWQLSGGAVDTLQFGIDHSGEDDAGACTIGGELRAVELNTALVLNDDTADHGSTEVLMEQAALLRITEMRHLGLNPPNVNVGQTFYFRVFVTNFGEDGAKQVQVSLSSNGFSAFPQSPIGLIGSLPGGAVDSVDILVQAAPSANAVERFTAQAQAYEDNTGHLFFDQALGTSHFYDTTIQSPGQLAVSQLVLSRNSVVAGQVDPWTIEIVVVNTGTATITLSTPASTDVGFYGGGILQGDYIVTAPTALNGGGLILNQGEQDTLKYTVSATGRLGGVIEIRAQIDATDNNDGTVLSTPGTSSVQVESETEFRIIQSYVRTPHRNEAGNGFVDTQQQFQVVVKLENGLGQTIRDIQVDLIGDGASVIAQSRKSVALLTPSAIDSVIFDVTAPVGAVAAGERFTAAIAGGFLVTSGSSAPVGPALDALATVYVQTPAALVLDIALSHPAGQVSADQVFVFSATLSNAGEGAVDASGAVRIVLPEGYSLEPNQGISQPIAVDGTVHWDVRSPLSHHSPPRTAYAILEPIPLAVNTGAQAAMGAPTVSIDVQTVETALTANLSIDSPGGAVDGVLSTGQNFVLRLSVMQQNVQQISATLSLPAGYSTADNFVKSINAQDVFWHISAPSTAAQARNIQVSVEGKDVFQPEETVTGQGDMITVTAVGRADLSLALETSDNSVSLGQIFTVTATLSNQGSAGTTGSAAVTLNPLPAGYVTADPATKILQNGQASWAIKAPVQPTQEAVNIVAALSTVPLDENTSSTAYVSQAQDKVAMTTVGAWLSVGTLDRPENVDGLVASGEGSVWAASYEFINRGETGANGIIFYALQFHLEDEQGTLVTPSEVLSRVRLVGMEKVEGVWRPRPAVVYGGLESVQLVGGNPMRIPFTQLLKVSAQDTTRLALLVDVTPDAVSRRFNVSLRSQSSVEVQDEYSPDISILVYDMTGAEFSNLSGYTQQVVAEADGAADEPTLIPCPNPFGMAGKERTYLVYQLPEDSEVTFRIFTLTGELVWSAVYEAASPQGAAGLHGQGGDEVTWDGRNDRGERVLSGVYVCFMETGGGKRVSTKIAVIY